MLAFLRTRFPEVATAVAPLVGVVCALQLLLVQASAALFMQFLLGSLLAMLGMLLLFAGIDVGILPMGRFIGAELPKKGSVWLILGVAFALGFATTVAEPDVLVLSSQVDAASDGALRGQTLIYVIAAGVGLFVAIGLLRVVKGFSMTALLGAVADPRDPVMRRLMDARDCSVLITSGLTGGAVPPAISARVAGIHSDDDVSRRTWLPSAFITNTSVSLPVEGRNEMK